MGCILWGGGGAGVGAGGSIGVQAGGSNAKTVCDLRGPFVSASGSGGTMPKVPSEMRGLGVPASELNPTTGQLSRWSGRFGTRILREVGRSAVGIAVGAAATAGVVFEGFYDWSVIGQAAIKATSTDECSCKK